MATIGKVSAVFTASTSGLRSGVNQATSAMSSLERSARSTARGMNALVAISGAQLFGSVVSGAARAAGAFASLASSAGQFISKTVQDATDLGEEMSKSSVIFGGAADAIGEFAGAASAIGLSETAALRATGTFGNLFTAMGLGKDTAADYATNLTKLGADLASFNNSTVDDAVMALGAALRGESEPIRRFGVLLDEATLKQEALAAGLISSTKGSLTPAIKAQAAYAAILKQTALAQGDFERTSGSLANLGRIVQAQTSNIFADIGKAFQPLFTSALSSFSKVLDAVGPFAQELVDGVAGSISAIGGAIEALAPQFIAFIESLDGVQIGQQIGDAIANGARFLAQVGDSLIPSLTAVWNYAQGVAASWSTIWAAGQRVISFLGIYVREFEAVFKFVGSVLTGLVGRILNAAGELVQLATFGGYGKDTEKSGEAMMRTSRKLWKESGDAMIAAAENAADFMFGPETTSAAGEKLAGPLESALDAAMGKTKEAAATIQQATSKPIEVKQTATATVDMSPVKKAVEGIDSRSSEGLKTMFRIMRGDTGNDVQERQLRELERIADNTEDIDGGTAEFDVIDLAPAAGA